MLSRSRLLTPAMLVAAVRALSSQSPCLHDPYAGLVPDVTNVREISVQIASAVIKQAVEEGVATEKGIPKDKGELEEWVREQMWEPRYRPLVRVDKAQATTHGKGEAGVRSVKREAK